MAQIRMHGAFFLEEKSVRVVFLIYLEFFEVFNHFLFLYGLLCKTRIVLKATFKNLNMVYLSETEGGDWSV